MKKREKAERILAQMTMAFRLPQNNDGNISYNDGNSSRKLQWAGGSDL